MPCRTRHLSRNALTVHILLLVLVVTGHGRQFCSQRSVPSQWTAPQVLTTVLCEQLLWCMEVAAQREGRAFAIRLRSGSMLARQTRDGVRVAGSSQLPHRAGHPWASWWKTQRRARGKRT